MEISRDERTAWIVLRQIPQVGPVHFIRLIRRFGTAQCVLRQSREDLLQSDFPARIAKEIAVHSRNDSLRKEAEAELDRVDQEGCRLLLYIEPDYPVNLKNIYAPPPYIYLRGKIQPQDRLAISMVGSRKATRDGILMSGQLAKGLAQRNLTVVSGFARGIDSTAHRGAIEGGGRTLAVFGSGLRHCYPPENKELYSLIPEHGALISELPMDAPPERKNFPPRNRIIAGLGIGVLIVEAPKKSGALITAKFAKEQNREVFAVPGRVPGGYSAGCHELIRDGAILVENEWDVISAITTEIEQISNEIGMVEQDTSSESVLAEKSLWDELPRSEPREKPPLSEEEDQLWTILSENPTHIDHLARKSGFEVSKVTRLLLGLQLKQLVRQEAGMQFLRTV